MKKVYDRIVDMRGNLLTVEAQNVSLGEIARIQKQNGESTYATVLRIAGEKVTLQAFENTRGISTHDRVSFLGKQMQAVVSEALLGRCFDGAGDPIDKGPTVVGLAGFLWRRLLPAISDMQFWQVLTFAAVLLVYAATEKTGGSELFAVMAFGATLANLSNPRSPGEEMGFWILAPDHSHQIHSFHSELAFLVRSFFFVLLGALVEFGGLRKQALASLGIVGVLFTGRVLAVQFSRVAWRGTSSREREIAILLIPRGLITAVLALEAIEANPGSLAFLSSLTFAVILLTNLLVLLAAIRAKGVSAAQPVPTDPVPVT